VSKIEEIERAIERLPIGDFVQFANWFDQRRQELSKSSSAPRDHTAFLNSYAPEDEGLYDDAATG
jgi:hypothetical protein